MFMDIVEAATLQRMKQMDESGETEGLDFDGRVALAEKTLRQMAKRQMDKLFFIASKKAEKKPNPPKEKTEGEEEQGPIGEPSKPRTPLNFEYVPER